VRTRELITLVLLAALGGADAQVAAHVTGNLNVGNGRATMTDAITAVLPWIGYPRTLNALRAIDQGTNRPDNPEQAGNS
jgi:4-carboxymuconolactone decarboxylase